MNKFAQIVIILLNLSQIISQDEVPKVFVNQDSEDVNEMEGLEMDPD